MDTLPDARRRRRRWPWRWIAWGLAAGLVLLPLVAMRFTREVNWGPGDFVLAALMVGGAGGLYELAVRTSASHAYRAGAAIALGGAFVLVWANLAVGIIGSEDNPANLVYAGVLGTGVVGALLARFRPHGLARAMAATALAQVLAFVVALVAGWGFTGPVTVFFTGLWLAAGWLFRRATRGQGG